MAVTPRDPDLSAILASLSDRVTRLERPSAPPGALTAADASLLIGGTSTAPTAKVPIRNGSVVTSTDGSARIQITYASHDTLVAAPFPTATNQGPVVCIGDNLGNIIVLVDAATLTAAGFKVVLYNSSTGAPLASAGPYRVNYVATGH